MSIFLAYIAGSIFVAYVGRNTRFGYWGNFFASLLMTPLVGLLMVLAAGPAKNTATKDVGPKLNQ